MAISPKDALGSKREHEAAAIARLESDFDAKLKANYDGRTGVTIDRPKGLSAFVLREVLERFKAAGWKIEEDSDQRDGTSWFTFSAKQS